MSEVAIKVENLSKVYKLYNDPIDRLKEALHPFRKKYHHDFYALKDVSFEVKRGETIGIIGKNGSGKSTLLKILTEVLTPNSGNVFLHGKVSSLLELGVGFNPELTGLENVYFNGAVLGFSKEEIDKKLDSILEFADIGEFVGQLVKTYSSGMAMRLAFAVAISVDPDILIVDEALAVGDIRFQQKCFRKFREFQENGKTIIFVTHDVGAVVNYCDRAIWLLDGGMYKTGAPEEVTREYVSYMYYGLEDGKNGEEGRIKSKGEIGSCAEKMTDQVKDLDLETVDGCSFFGEGGAKINRVGLYSAETGKKIKVFKGGEKVDFYVEIEVLRDIENPIVGFIVKDEKGNAILGMNSYLIGMKLGKFKRGEGLTVDFKFEFPLLKNGNYLFSPAIAEGTQENHVQHCWVHDGYIVQVMNDLDSSRMGWYLIVSNSNISILNV